ncbi:hypothetical protein [Rhodococcus qingshengii]|uniref:hypothetical protein n=1 Tax=Rhodococcus qingshengii TaxID=334542 RepID=UPI001BE80425|nr:hypothetical protein [Rhodococcus qingshengii]MBT2273850.1 hypothetical protein [Rhodococcus qingshengii]
MGTIIFNDSDDANSSAWFDGSDELISALEIAIRGQAERGSSLIFVAGTGTDQPGAPGAKDVHGVVIRPNMLPSFSFTAGRVERSDIDPQLLQDLERAAEVGTIALDDDDVPTR